MSCRRHAVFTAGAFLLRCFVVVLCAAPSQAQTLRVGQAVSIATFADSAGELIAQGVELLPEPRRPVLRAPVEAVDPDSGAIRVLGQWILVDHDTEFESAGAATALSDLRVGEQIEVRCRVEKTGRWYARRITVADVKPSVKVKGTITALRYEGVLPYLVEISGLPILIVQSTDFEADENVIAQDLFADLKADDQQGDAMGYRFHVGSRLFLSGSARHIYRRENSFTLEESAEEGFSEPSARLEWLGLVSDNVKLFGQLRFQGRYGLHSSEIPPDLVSPNENRLQMRQLYLSVRDVAGHPFGFVVGKQRIRDPREFLFDEYLDAFRFYFYPWTFVAFEATLIDQLYPLKDKFDTWRDLLLQGRFYFSEDWRARVSYLRRWDTHARRRTPQYLGLSLDGRSRSAKVWADGFLLRGEDKGRAQRAFAWDVGISLRGHRATWQPSMTLSLARGSGDSDPDDDVSGRFRQTGYEDNSRRHWGVANFQSYGEVLDPELSNLLVYTLGVGITPTSHVSLDVIYHVYRLDRLTDELKNTDLLTPEEVLTGDRSNLGIGLDVVLGTREIADRLHLTYKLGLFFPGAAFDLSTNHATVQRFELKLDI